MRRHANMRSRMLACRRHFLKRGRWLAPALVCALIGFGPSMFAVPGSPEPPPFSPINSFVPFEHPEEDFYSFEVSDLEVYNL